MDSIIFHVCSECQKIVVSFIPVVSHPLTDIDIELGMENGIMAMVLKLSMDQILAISTRI